MNNTATCPRRIRDTIEIGPEYLEFLMPMLKDGMPISNILFVPAPPNQTERKEYVLIVYKDHLLYMDKQPLCPAHATAIHRANLFAVRMFGNAVTATFLLYFMQDGKLQRLQIPFDRSQREHYSQMLNWCFRQNEAFAPKDAPISFPQKLQTGHPSLCTLAADAALLGDAIGDASWWDIKSGSLFGSRDPQYACLLQQLRMGQAVAYTHGANVNLWLIFNGRGSTELVKKEKTQSLVIKIGEETVITVEHLLPPQLA